MNIWKIVLATGGIAAAALFTYSFFTDEPAIATPPETNKQPESNTDHEEMIAAVNAATKQCEELNKIIVAMNQQYAKAQEEIATAVAKNDELTAQCTQMADVIKQSVQQNDDTNAKATEVLTQCTSLVAQMSDIIIKHGQNADIIRITAKGYSDLTREVNTIAQQCDQMAEVVNNLIEKGDTTRNQLDTVIDDCKKIIIATNKVVQDCEQRVADFSQIIDKSNSSAAIINALVERHDQLTHTILTNNEQTTGKLDTVLNQCTAATAAVTEICVREKQYVDIVNQTADKYNNAIDGVESAAKLCLQSAGVVENAASNCLTTTAQITECLEKQQQFNQDAQNVVETYRTACDSKTAECDHVISELNQLIERNKQAIRSLTVTNREPPPAVPVKEQQADVVEVPTPPTGNPTIFSKLGARIMDNQPVTTEYEDLSQDGITEGLFVEREIVGKRNPFTLNLDQHKKEEPEPSITSPALPVKPPPTDAEIEQEREHDRWEAQQIILQARLEDLNAHGVKIDPATVPDDCNLDPKPDVLNQDYYMNYTFVPYVLPPKDKRFGHWQDLEEKLEAVLKGCTNLHWYGGDVLKYRRPDGDGPVGMEDERGNPIILRYGEWPNVRYYVPNHHFPYNLIRRITVKERLALRTIEKIDEEFGKIREARRQEAAAKAS